MVDGGGLENRRGASSRGFESLPLRHDPGRLLPGRRGASSEAPRRGAAAPLDSGLLDADLLTGLRALVDADRLRIVARLATRPADADTLAAEPGQPVPSVRRHLDTLVAAGLVEPRPDGTGGSRG